MSVPPSPYMQHPGPPKQPEMMPGPPKMPGVWGDGFRHYDSGIQSAMASGPGSISSAASVMSGVSSLHGDLVGSYENAYAPPQYTQLTERTDELSIRYDDGRQIRDGMFPEINTEHDLSVQTTGHYELAPATTAAAASHDDADLATGAVPELLKLLTDPDSFVVHHAVMMVHEMMKRPKSRMALLSTKPLMEAIVRTLETSQHQDSIRHMAGTLYLVSQDRVGLQMIMSSGAVPVIVGLLNSPQEALLHYAVTTLHNLLINEDRSKSEVRAANGIQAMLPLLDIRNEKFIAILVDCLHNLTSSHPQSKIILLENGGVAKLVRVMRECQYEKLLYHTARVLKVLSVCPRNKVAIVQAGGMTALQKNLGHLSHRLIKNSLWALRNLSDAATKETNLADLLCSMLQMIGSSDRDVVTCCVGIMSNLTCNNQINKQTITDRNGVECLLRAIRMHHDHVDIVEPCLCALRHLTARHDKVALAHKTMRDLNGIGIVCELIAQMRPPFLKAALGLVRNLAVDSDNQVALREARATNGKGIIQMCMETLDVALGAIRQDTHTIENVTMCDLMQCSITALDQLAQEPLSRAEILVNNGAMIPLLIHLLTHEQLVIEKAASSILSRLSLEPDGARLIGQNGAEPVLQQLLCADNENIRMNASEILYRLGAFAQPEVNDNMVEPTLYDMGNNWTPMDALSGGDLQDELFSDVMYPNADPVPLDQIDLGTPWGAPPNPNTNIYQAPPGPGWYNG